MKKLFILAALLLPLAMASCNTISGMGQDISGAADATKKVITR